MNNEQKAREIRRLLAKYNIRQTQIAKRAQVSSAVVSRAISNPSKSNPALRVIWEMLKEKSADESQIAFLLGEEEDLTTDQPPLKRLLHQAGLTQRYIAQKAQVSCATVHMTVNGKSKSRRIERIIRQEVEEAHAKQASTGIDNRGQENPGHRREPRQDTADVHVFGWAAEGSERTLKKQREQQKPSDLTGTTQEYLRMIQDNIENPGLESQINGWITVLDSWRRIWETQEEKKTQPATKEREAYSLPLISPEKKDYLKVFRELLLVELKKNTPNPVLSRAIDEIIELWLKKEDHISYLQFKAVVMRLYAEFLEIRIPDLEKM